MDYVNDHLKAHPGRVRRPIVCKDGTRLSVQASEGHYCSPKDRVGPYSSVEVCADKYRPGLWKAFGHTNDRYSGGLWGWVSVDKVNAEIARRGGLAK